MSQYIWSNPQWPKFNWDEALILKKLAEVRFKQGQLITRMRNLNTIDSVAAQAEILVAETIQTAQIEGEKYDPVIVRSSVNRQLGIAYAGLPQPSRNVAGLVEVLLDATTQFDQKLTVPRLQSWQAALFPTGYSGLHQIKVGGLRDDQLGPMQVVSGPIGKEQVHYEAPPALQLTQEMAQFLAWWDESEHNLEGVIRAGVAHFYFITLHPFEDGNGRLARALTDMALAQDDGLNRRYYSLSDQIVKTKASYYAILERTQKGDLSITDWLLWFLDCFDRALQHSEKLLEKVWSKAAFWQKHQQLQLNMHQSKVLNILLDAGRGGFQGGLTTRKYVSFTKTSRATAYREIVDLLEKNILKANEGKGRSVSYDLKW